MIVTVWQRDEPSFMDNAMTTLREFPQGFTALATVEAALLDAAYMKTQNTETPWFERPDITLLPAGKVAATVEGGIRSTSVGDVLTTDAGGCYTIDGIGFHQFIRRGE